MPPNGTTVKMSNRNSSEKAASFQKLMVISFCKNEIDNSKLNSTIPCLFDVLNFLYYN